MSDTKPRRPTREFARENGIRGAAKPAEVAEAIPALVPETATAAVALETAAAETVAESAAKMAEPAAQLTASADDAWAAWAESQSALARGFEALATELTGMTHSGIAATTEAAKAMIDAKTFVEAVEINANLARRSFDAVIEGTAKISEISVKAATEASRPVLNRLGETWKSLGAH
ncbi:MAG TPA: phasin family protein [Stellaceae bacterium]